MARAAARPALITSARIGASLSADQRAKRYVTTMLFRAACFVIGAFLPLPWNIVAFVLAAFLPGIAVLLANAADRRLSQVEARPEAEHELRALPPGLIVRGDIDHQTEDTKDP